MKVKHGEMKQQHPLEEDQDSGRSRGRPHGGRVRGTTTRRVRSRSPVIQGSAEVSTVHDGRLLRKCSHKQTWVT